VYFKRLALQSHHEAFFFSVTAHAAGMTHPGSAAICCMAANCFLSGIDAFTAKHSHLSEDSAYYRIGMRHYPAETIIM